MSHGRVRVAVVTVAVVAAAVFLATVPARRGFFDLGVYRDAVRYWLVDGGGLYDYVRPPRFRYGFTYPPFAGFVFSPLAGLGWHRAIALSIAVNAAAVGLLVRWLCWPVIRRQGWVPWSALALAACAVAVFEPVRDTFSFGQVNLVLLVLVLADLRMLRRGRLAGIGIGLASAIKLTPAIFILYLLVAGRRRDAGVATATAAGATIVTAVIAPDASRAFWTGALWHTERIGDLAYVSNQSLRGVLARLDPQLSGWVWVAVAVAVLVLWVARARPAAVAGDHATGFALTGVAGCLVSPVTWVHHLVWLLPALVLLLDAGLRATDARRTLLAATAASYVLLCSSVVWLWWADSSGWDGFVGSNTYVWISLALLAGLPGPRVPNAAEPAAGRSRAPVAA